MSDVEGEQPSSSQLADPYQVYFARQPMLDRDGMLCAYETLPRVVLGEVEGEVDPRASAGAALLKAFATPTLRAALSGHPAWLDMTREALFDDALLRLPADRVVFELPVGIGADPELIARLVTLHGKRYRFALDNVTKADESFAKLLPYVDAIKIDTQDIAPALLPKFASVLKSAGKLLVALKVETAQAHDHAHALGFDRFQGYYFAKHQGGLRRASAPRQALLNLLQLLAAEPTVMQLEAELKLNPVLVMHLMRLANSGSYALGRKVTTLREAINATGTNRIARWTQLLLYADGRKVKLEDDPLLQLAATRARFMELATAILPEAGPSEEDAAFLVGVFSFVDAVFGGSLDEALEVLRLPKPIRAAISRREGVLGRLLDVIEALERGDWAAVDMASAALAPLDAGAIAALALTAAEWAGMADSSAEAQGLERIED
ncbi:c-di-GMP-related signal transduction protein [Paraburkholderia eburnea]|uniref:C-di-GMP-related signal transduction protein n=1 Tax=Paraburkholderia eburnea TaxID=1189126 RepID=A0A2S4LUD1_9BURK|nr:EAL domain-containing protein [Paraburkholderia eburnea]POR46040.1 c-di-GMP-related signal transduction protein [Paraburkholderia eburnea]PRZ15756.1 c-di-GMP-related signal transduction protein [Paraburkholderia eburnea]